MPPRASKNSPGPTAKKSTGAKMTEPATRSSFVDDPENSDFARILEFLESFDKGQVTLLEGMNKKTEPDELFEALETINRNFKTLSEQTTDLRTAHDNDMGGIATSLGDIAGLAKQVTDFRTAHDENIGGITTSLENITTSQQTLATALNVDALKESLDGIAASRQLLTDTLKSAGDNMNTKEIEISLMELQTQQVQLVKGLTESYNLQDEQTKLLKTLEGGKGSKDQWRLVEGIDDLRSTLNTATGCFFWTAVGVALVLLVAGGMAMQWVNELVRVTMRK